VALWPFVEPATQREPEVIGNIERAVKELDPEWACERKVVPHGEPGPESPRGTKYEFVCRHQNRTLLIWGLYGDAKSDAEKELESSQRLQIDESKPLAGLGDQAYELGKESFAWINFRKANVFVHVQAGLNRAQQTEESSTVQVSSAPLLEVVKRFAVRVAAQIPMD